MVRPVLATAMLIGTAASPAVAQPRAPERNLTRLAAGVYLIEHPDALPDFPQANTTVVIGERSVLVVDPGYLPSSAREDIAQIRRWTDKPVRYLVITHGHSDHVTTSGIYARAFPGLSIVAHRETRKLMARYTPGYPALFEARTAQLQKTLDAGRGDDGKPLGEDARAGLTREIDARRKVSADLATMGDNPLPDLTLDQDALGIDLGGREVTVKFLGRGNTAGDLTALLPAEKIAIVGDVLVSPVPYTCSGFPVDWVATLDRIAALAPSIIVPGHGEPMRDLRYLRDMRDLLQSVITQVDAIFQHIPGGGQSSLEHAREAVNVSAFRDRFPAGNQYNPDFFGRAVPNCLVRNVYYQLAPR